MANTLMTPPEVDREEKTTDRHSADYEPHLGVDPELEGESVFASLWSNLRDVFFPTKLPPLHLESKPVPVADRMAVKRDPVSTGVAVVFHALVILLLFWVGHRVLTAPPAVAKKVAAVDLNAPVPKVITKPSLKAMGGGGGAHDMAPVSKGRLPKFATEQIVPPSRPPEIPPKLAVDPTLVMQPNMKMTNNNMPNLGDPRSPNVGVSLGNGGHGGIGSGNGSGLGPGEGGGTGGGVFQIGGGISAPILVFQPDPEFSEEARKAKFQGEVLVNLVVDATGRPTRVRVIRPVGMGLDEKALEAVRQYKFKPARKGTQAVAVELNVAVNFQIF
jgi:periplasmic protein TonB